MFLALKNAICAPRKVHKNSVGENPTYAKANHHHRSDYCIAGGDERDEANKSNILGYNASEGIELRNIQ